MKSTRAARHRSQAGYTLIELVIASGIGVIVMASLTSVVLTAVMASNTATSRVEASTQIRSFELSAYDDFAHSKQPALPASCGSAGKPFCTVEALVLSGLGMPNTVSAPTGRDVSYVWNRSRQLVTRSGPTGSRNVATNVTAFDWHVDNSGAHATVVVNMTVTVDFFNGSHVQSQALQFLPRVTQ